jgi:hypothetical protein
MPVYTLRLTPDSLSGDFWVDLGNENHVELNELQAKQLLNFIEKSGARKKKEIGFHPKTLAPIDTLSYDDSGQLDKVSGDEVQVLLGKGIITKTRWNEEDAKQSAVDNKGGGKSRRRRGKKAKRSRRRR